MRHRRSAEYKTQLPERKGLRKSKVEGLCLKRFAQVQGRVAHGARWAAGVGRT